MQYFNVNDTDRSAVKNARDRPQYVRVCGLTSVHPLQTHRPHAKITDSQRRQETIGP
jgi:hypothetical protein